MEDFRLPVVKHTEEMKKLKYNVRAFIEDELINEGFKPQCDSWLAGFSPEFSRKLGSKGWIGITIPERYGGAGGSALDRYIVTEELLAAGAPVAAHWVADRQTAPLLLRYGTEKQREKFLHQICRGECYFSIGLSEANAGSDLASITTRAEKKGDEWILNGSKIWTSGAHNSDYMIVLCRTSKKTEKRHDGLSQLILKISTPGVTVRPINLLTGEHHFNEVFFEDVRIPSNMLIGEEGNGWNQSMTELAFERSGPERFLSTFPLLEEAIRIVKEKSSGNAKLEIGKLISNIWTLRRMSIGVASMLNDGQAPNVAAALVKDIGTKFEVEVIETVRLLIECMPSRNSQNHYQSLLAQAILHSPGFTLRGGTTEILRSIISRGLGV